MEKQRDKAARRLQRKAEKAAGITHTEDDSAESGEQDDESGEFSLGAGSNPGNETI
ncbi:MAG TPA: hypothetical protein VMH81_17505 [Bryobacteraceae bacterium]|nr:hypothetical protein [Bryobacteraceae bacterium]